MSAINILLHKIQNKLNFLIGRSENKLSDIEYWQMRVKQYGKRSVLNIGHSEDEFDEVTQKQKDKIFPFLREYLTGTETLVLDYGCGSGRFTPDLAEIIKAKAIGVDILKSLIDLSLKKEKVEYRLMTDNHIPLETSSVDIVWICLVLGGITKNSELDKSISEIFRVLSNDGLLFLIENTSDKKSGVHWKFRTVEEYQKLFYYVDLKHLSDYFSSWRTYFYYGWKNTCLN